MRGSMQRRAASTLLPSCLYGFSALQTPSKRLSNIRAVMDFRSEASPWAIRDLTEDIFGVSPASCPESSWEEALDARVPESCLDVLPGGRHRTPSPSIACIDPRLTVLWPSPPASPSEEESSASVDDSWTAFDDWDQESPGARVPECVLEGTATQTLNDESGSNESNTGPGMSFPIRERELRKTRSTVVTRASAAAARNTKAMVKGPDKTHTKWKCRTKGDIGGAPPSGPSFARISQMGRRPDPETINNSSNSSSSSGSSRNSSNGESRQAEGIEKIHMKLWKCRIGGCNKTFHRKGDAVRHLQTTARHNGRAVVCNCGAPFSRHDALKRHQRLCNGHTS